MPLEVLVENRKTLLRDMREKKGAVRDLQEALRVMELDLASLNKAIRKQERQDASDGD